MLGETGEIAEDLLGKWNKRSGVCSDREKIVSLCSNKNSHYEIAIYGGRYKPKMW